MPASFKIRSDEMINLANTATVNHQIKAGSQTQAAILQLS